MENLLLKLINFLKSYLLAARDGCEGALRNEALELYVECLRLKKIDDEDRAGRAAWDDELETNVDKPSEVPNKFDDLLNQKWTPKQKFDFLKMIGVLPSTFDDVSVYLAPSEYSDGLLRHADNLICSIKAFRNQ